MTCPQIGDKISSPRFAFSQCVSTYFQCKEVSLLSMIRRDRIPATKPDEAHDEAVFVIEYVATRDRDGWYNIEHTVQCGDNATHLVFARRLHPSGLYNPKGELIRFCYQDSFDHTKQKTGELVVTADITIHGHMNRTFI